MRTLVACFTLVLLLTAGFSSKANAQIESQKHKEIIRLFYVIEEGRMFELFIDRHLASLQESMTKQGQPVDLSTNDALEREMKGFKPNYLNRAMLAYDAAFSLDELREVNKVLAGKGTRGIHLYLNEQRLVSAGSLSEEETFSLMEHRFGAHAVRVYRARTAEPVFAKYLAFAEKITAVRLSFLDEVWALILQKQKD